MQEQAGLALVKRVSLPSSSSLMVVSDGRVNLNMANDNDDGHKTRNIIIGVAVAAGALVALAVCLTGVCYARCCQRARKGAPATRGRSAGAPATPREAAAPASSDKIPARGYSGDGNSGYGVHDNCDGYDAHPGMAMGYGHVSHAPMNSYFHSHSQSHMSQASQPSHALLAVDSGLGYGYTSTPGTRSNPSRRVSEARSDGAPQLQKQQHEPEHALFLSDGADGRFVQSPPAAARVSFEPHSVQQNYAGRTDPATFDTIGQSIASSHSSVGGDDVHVRDVPDGAPQYDDPYAPQLAGPPALAEPMAHHAGASRSALSTDGTGSSEWRTRWFHARGIRRSRGDQGEGGDRVATADTSGVPQRKALYDMSERQAQQQQDLDGMAMYAVRPEQHMLRGNTCAIASSPPQSPTLQQFHSTFPGKPPRPRSPPPAFTMPSISSVDTSGGDWRAAKCAGSGAKPNGSRVASDALTHPSGVATASRREAASAAPPYMRSKRVGGARGMPDGVAMSGAGTVPHNVHDFGEHLTDAQEPFDAAQETQVFAKTMLLAVDADELTHQRVGNMLAAVHEAAVRDRRGGRIDDECATIHS